MKELFLTGIAILLMSCNANNTKGEEFAKFNQKFHSDSVFQMSRIKFPIGGKKVEGWQERETWNTKNWEILKSPVTSKNKFKEFQHKVVYSDTLVTEKYWLPDAGFSTEVRFQKVDGKWFLVYFNDVNL